MREEYLFNVDAFFVAVVIFKIYFVNNSRSAPLNHQIPARRRANTRVSYCGGLKSTSSTLPAPEKSKRSSRWQTNMMNLTQGLGNCANAPAKFTRRSPNKISACSAPRSNLAENTKPSTGSMIQDPSRNAETIGG